jgi:hypothetical protein
MDLPIVVIACQVLQDVFEQLLPVEQAGQVPDNTRLTFMDYGLHRTPAKMTWTLQDAINSIQEPSLVVLGYGLCGNGLNGIKAGIHTLLVPKADDCIAILLGSRQAYFREFDAEPGTYYLSKGWLESGSHLLKEYEEYVEKYDPEDAQWIMDQQYQNYNRLALVAHTEEDLATYRPQAQEVASYCEQWGMRYEEILGSDSFIRRLINMIAVPEEKQEDILVIPPGGEIRQELFI